MIIIDINDVIKIILWDVAYNIDYNMKYSNIRVVITYITILSMKALGNGLMKVGNSVLNNYNNNNIYIFFSL